MTKHGLCNSHGHCAFDKINKESYCYCNAGYKGDSCSDRDDNSSYDGFSVQLGLLITLLVITTVLVGIVGVMIYRIFTYRKEQEEAVYSALTTSSMEMSDRSHF